MMNTEPYSVGAQPWFKDVQSPPPFGGLQLVQNRWVQFPVHPPRGEAAMNSNPKLSQNLIFKGKN